jgi:hypothetical protein
MGHKFFRRKRRNDKYFEFPRLQNKNLEDSTELRSDIKKPSFIKSVKIIGDRMDKMDKNWFVNTLRDLGRLFRRDEN